MSDIKQKSPLISVILPVYNAEKYLSEAIDSILNQTFTDFEFIIINDGSTDNSSSILQSYQTQDSRIRLFSRENKGIVMTMNEGIDLARGEWLARMDADDIAMPSRFERQLQHLKETSADICGAWIEFFGNTKQRIVRYPESDQAIKIGLLFCSCLAQPTVMLRINIARRFYYNPQRENGEDYDLWVRIAQAGYVMTNLPEVMLLYRQHALQISSRSFIQQQQNTQEIKRRYWTFLADALDIKLEWIDEVLKLRESPAIKSDMNAVDSAFTALLQQSQGEARVTVLDHMTRLYFRATADCPDIALRWHRLNRTFGTELGLATVLKLWLLSMLKFNSDSKAFSFLKQIYFRTR